MKALEGGLVKYLWHYDNLYLANIYPGGVYEIPQGLKKKTLNDQGILEGKFTTFGVAKYTPEV